MAPATLVQSLLLGCATFLVAFTVFSPAGVTLAFDGFEAPEEFFDSKIIFDRSHILEHLPEYDSSKEGDMTEDSLRFYYFELHDTDGNRKLDGLEILAALRHSHKEHDHTKVEVPVDPIYDHEERWIELNSAVIDRALQNHDNDGDGYLTYTEYVYAVERILKSSENF